MKSPFSFGALTRFRVMTSRGFAITLIERTALVSIPLDAETCT